MTKSGFDLDELERRLTLHDPAWWRMNTPTLTAYEVLPAMLTEIRELRAENARLREALEYIASVQITGRKVHDFARAALGEPQ